MAPRRAVLALDLGTTTTKAALVDAGSLDIIDRASSPTPIHYPREGWAEQDPGELWSLIAGLSRRLVESNPEVKVEALVFSTYLAGLVLLDGDGEALTNIITWLDERAAGLPREAFSGPIRIAGYNPLRLAEFLWITGGAPSKTGKDPLSKIAWLREYMPREFRAARWIGNLKSWLLARTTGRHATSPDEAHLTWLADTRGGRARWSRRLLARYGVPAEKMPEILEPASVAGGLRRDAASDLGLEAGIPVVVGAGDIASVAVGTGAVGVGEYHVYIGTSDWVAAHTPKRLLDVSHYIGSLLSAIPGLYLVIAEQEVAGAMLDWLLALLGEDYRLLEEAAKEPPGAGGILAAPWMFGERCPVDDPHARGVLLGLSLRHGRASLARAVVEGVSLNIAWALGYMERLAGAAERLRAAGGAFKSRLWARVLASVTGRRVEVVSEPDSAGLRGAAVLAVSAVAGRPVEEIARRIPVAYSVEPDPSWSRVYTQLLAAYKRLYGRLKPVFRDLSRIR